MKYLSKENIVRMLMYLCLLLVTFNIEIFNVSFLDFQISLFRILICITIILGLIFKFREIFKIDNSIKYYVLFMVVWVLYAVVSGIWSKDKYEWFQTIYFLFLGLSTLVLFNKYITNRKYLLNCFYSLSFATIIHIVIGLNEYIFQNYWFIKDEYLLKYMYNRWPVSTFTNTNNYAFYLGLSLCVLLFVIKFSKNIWIKRIYFFISILTILLIATTSSRGVILALIFSIIFLLLNKHVFYNAKRELKFIYISLFSMLLFSVVFLCVIAFTNVDYFQSPNNSNSIRLNLSFNSIYFLIKSSFIGVGAGNFEFYLINNAIFDTNGIINSHNWWFEILSEYGIIIFSGYILYIINIYKSTQGIVKTKYRYDYQYITLLFLSIFSIGCISPSSILSMEWMWLLMNVVIVGISISQMEDNYEDIVINEKYNDYWWGSKSSNISS